MRWVQKSGVKLFRLSFSYWQIQYPVEKLKLDSRKTQSKNVESKKPFLDCKKARFGLQSKQTVFD